jgi:hypothetical protein
MSQPAPVNLPGALPAVQHAALPIANALAIPRLIASSDVPPIVSLTSHGVGTAANHSA